MSSSRKKKKKKQANQVYIKKAANLIVESTENKSVKGENPMVEREERESFSTENKTAVEIDSLCTPDACKEEELEQADFDREPDGKEYDVEATADEPKEQPSSVRSPEEPEPDNMQGKEEKQAGQSNKELPGGNKLPEVWDTTKRTMQKIGRKTAELGKVAGCKAQACSKKIWEKAPVCAKALKKVKPRYWIAGGAAAAAALIALVMVGIFCWEWFGIIIHQRPVAGTWSMEQAQPATYLTLREDGTAIVSTDGLSVKGTYNLLEDDRITFHVATQEVDVWMGDFHYWATDAGLTLTRLGEETSENEQDQTGNVLQFSRQEEDVTCLPVPKNPKVDPELVGTWSDVSKNVTYTFRSDGTLVIDFRGAYYNATYSAQKGKLEIVTYIPGQQSKQESNEYAIENGMLSFSNMELLKENK